MTADFLRAQLPMLAHLSQREPIRSKLAESARLYRNVVRRVLRPPRTGIYGTSQFRHHVSGDDVNRPLRFALVPACCPRCSAPCRPNAVPVQHWQRSIVCCEISMIGRRR